MQGGDDLSIDELVSNLSTYKDQLREVNRLLADDPRNSEYADMKKELEEVIELTEELLSTARQNDSGIGTSTGTKFVSDELPYFEHKFSIGTKVEAVWSEDGEWYTATIEALTPNGYFVSDDKYGNKEEVDPMNVREIEEEREVNPIKEAERDTIATKEVIKRKIQQASLITDFEARELPSKLKIDTNDPDEVETMEAIQVSSLINGSPVYGREDDKKSIIRLVLSDDCKTRNVTFICLIAPSGTGKSTIAHLVYNEEAVCDAFDARVFIYVPGKFDEKKLMKEMIESLTSSYCRETEMDQLEDILVDELIGKRILLVLDNAENEYHLFWNYVETLLNHGSKGSVVITTGRKLVNYVMGRYDLNPLSNYYSWLIFERYAFRDLNINAYPELVQIGKQLIEKCLNHPLCIKVLGVLLSSSQNQQFWISISERMLLEYAYPEVERLLTMCYNIMPMYLKKCFEYLSLFPKGYIFLKYQIVRIWNSAGLIIPVEGKEPEEVGAQYFDELLSRAFIEHSPIHNAKEDKFIMPELIHNLAEYSAQDKCFRLELDDRIIYASGDHIHFSLVPSEFQTDIVKLRTENLQTFLVVSRSSLPGRIFPILNLIDLNNLFTKSIFLTTLELSYTDIVELPGSIGLLTNLSYLGINNTKIKSLPRELCTVISLQILEAKECYHLIELPDNLKLLINLRHLNVIKKSGFVKLPVGIGQLTNLRILTAFNIVAETEKQQCGIEELKDLNFLKGCLQIAGLENIESGASAKEANLKNKVNLETLCLQWSKTNRDEGSAIVAEEIFENMKPNSRIKELIVRNYIGSHFPVWMGDPSFTELVSIILDKCINCSMFPSLGALPSLRQLSIQKMYHVKTLENTDCRVGTNIMFPSLEKLNIWEMYDLKELFEVRDGDFPRLRTLSVNRCPMLKNIPCFPSLIEFSIYCCIKLPCIKDLPLLESMKIDGFQKIKSLDLPCNLPKLKSLEIKNCSELVSVDNLSNISSLEKLILDCCPTFTSLDGWVQIDLKAKRCCFIKEEHSVYGALITGGSTAASKQHSLKAKKSSEEVDEGDSNPKRSKLA